MSTFIPYSTNNSKVTQRTLITLDFEINIRAMLTAFYLGTGELDIGGYASFLGLPGGRGWE